MTDPGPGAPEPRDDATAREPKNRELASMRERLKNMQRLILAVGIVAGAALVACAFLLLRDEAAFERLVLRDARGAVRGVLEVEEGFAQLLFFDADGTKRATFDQAGMLLFGDSGTTMLRELVDSSRLEFRRSFGGVETRTWLVNDGEQLQLIFRNYDTDDQVRLTLDTRTGARLLVKDLQNGTFALPAEKE